jgi:hypothetical protein
MEPAKQKRIPIYDWETKPSKDLKASDFSMFEDDPEPFMYMRDRFMYMNKAFIKQEEEIQVAMADYRDRSRNLTVTNYLSIYLIFFSILRFT